MQEIYILNSIPLLLGNAPENLVPCPCNSSESCFSFEVNGTEICGCLFGYIPQMDGQGDQVCTGNINKRDN